MHGRVSDYQVLYLTEVMIRTLYADAGEWGGLSVAELGGMTLTDRSGIRRLT